MKYFTCILIIIKTQFFITLIITGTSTSVNLYINILFQLYNCSTTSQFTGTYNLLLYCNVQTSSVLNFNYNVIYRNVLHKTDCICIKVAKKIKSPFSLPSVICDVLYFSSVLLSLQLKVQ